MEDLENAAENEEKEVAENEGESNPTFIKEGVMRYIKLYFN